MDASVPSKLQILAIPLLLTALLLAASTAHAMPLGSTVAPTFDEEFEAEETEFEEAECEEAEEEFEEGELGELEVEQLCEEASGKDGGQGGSDSIAPEECLLRSSHAHAVADSGSDKLKLTIGYTTWEPVGATLEIHAGSGHVGSIHRHLGRSGVLRIVESLGDGQAPNRAVVRIRIPGSPSFCGKFQTQKVSVTEVDGDAAPRHARPSKAR
jgi:hypothetical protein